VLSTVHSAKGREWEAVLVLNVIDGCIPSDMAVGNREQIEEERRLLYVAMTRARQHLHLVQPMRLFRGHQHRHGDSHILTMCSRFIPDGILGVFERRASGPAVQDPISAAGLPIRVDVAGPVAPDVGLGRVGRHVPVGRVLLPSSAKL
jgi:DNA helicase II / ATP-dependent DNA helicase PcrA